MPLYKGIHKEEERNNLHEFKFPPFWELKLIFKAQKLYEQNIHSTKITRIYNTTCCMHTRATVPLIFEGSAFL